MKYNRLRMLVMHVLNFKLVHKHVIPLENVYYIVN